MRCKYCQAEYEEKYNRCPNCGMREEYEASTVQIPPSPKRKKIWHNPFYWFWHAFSNFLQIKGRARRVEYFYYLFFAFLACLFLPLFYAGLVDKRFFDVPQEMAKNPNYLLAVMIVVVLAIAPYITLTIRRLHDIGLSGWYFLAAVAIQWALQSYELNKCATLIPLCLFFWPGGKEENEFGPDPRYVETEVRSRRRERSR